MKRRLAYALVVLALVVLGIVATGQSNQADARYEGTVVAPDFPAGLDWFNVPAPLSLTGLKGKVVLLDFWTYGCINCIHMIPVLRQLEAKYPDELVVIGVHSAKFANESESANIRQIVQRYELHHPVVNDKDFLVWRSYRANAWPTLAVIDPRGRLVAREAGEIPFSVLDDYIGGMIAYYDSLGLGDIDRTPLALALEGAGDPGTPLLYPGAVLADAARARLFITDSNHHRIVVADLNTYEVLAVIGAGTRGFSDGDFASAQFNQPQGIALDGQTLYVADTNNHAIRAIDLNAQTVRTLAGNGEMARTLARFGMPITMPTAVPLRSPWAVAVGAEPHLLHVAMAGMHQLHLLDLKANTLTPHVGNGREAQKNGTPAESELAQPSGLFYDAGRDWLYFADSESSTVRVVDFAQNVVRVISGTTDNNLFDFGDRDGIAGVSRLQHALDVTGTPDGETLYIADTYNNKIKRYERSTGATVTLFGGEAGFRDGDAATARFHEPGGVSYADGKLYVADTNNHAVRVIDLSTNTVSTITFPNPQALLTREVVVVGGNRALGERVTLTAQTVATGEVTLELVFTLPDGYKLNPLVNSFVRLRGTEGIQTPEGAQTLNDTTAALPLTLAEGEGVLTLEVTLYYCEANEERVCLIDDVQLTLPLRAEAGTDSRTLRVARSVQLPEAYR